MAKLSSARQKQLRTLCWTIGQHTSSYVAENQIYLYMVRPHQAFCHWTVTKSSEQEHTPLTIKAHDVTDLDFNGHNAHHTFTWTVDDWIGKSSFHIPDPERTWLVEMGIESGGTFHRICLSKPVYFDRSGPSQDYKPAGLFIGGNPRLQFNVPSIFNQSLYKKFLQTRRQWPELKSLKITCLNEKRDRKKTPANLALKTYKKLSKNFKTFGTSVQWLNPSQLEQLKETDILHCHDWTSLKAFLAHHQKLKTSCFFTFPETPSEPTNLKLDAEKLSLLKKVKQIFFLDQKTRDLLEQHHPTLKTGRLLPNKDPIQKKKNKVSSVFNDYGLTPDHPIVFFAGELSFDSGIDLLMDALPTLNGEYPHVQYLVAGEGQLKQDMEARIWNTGVAHQVRMCGHVPYETFNQIMSICDFLVVPARRHQNETPVRAALEKGKPILTTHQAHHPEVRHGVNGLVTYDNPGSIVWGIKEMLASSQAHLQKARSTPQDEANDEWLLALQVVTDYLEFGEKDL